jgi:hypothetical protein
MSTPWPKPWSGANPMSAWINRMLQRCKEEVLLESKDFRRVQTPNGYFLESKIHGGKGGTAGKPLDASYKMMVIKTLGSSFAIPLPNVMICAACTAAGIITGPDTYVAKSMVMRRNFKEYFFDNGANVTQNYVYFSATSNDPSYGDNFRTASDGSSSELQSADPRYYTHDMLFGLTSQGIPLTQAILYAVDTGIATGEVDPNGNVITMVEIAPCRVWTRVVSS